MIPKRIIQIWGGTAEIPLLMQSAMVNVRLLHPTFEYMLFDDAKIEAFLQELCPQYYAAYHSYQLPIQKFDFFRYLAVHHYGGFYLDTDVFLARDLTALLDNGCVFPFEELSTMKFFWERYGMDWQIGNYAFGARPGHPFLAAVIDNCLRAKKDSTWLEPMLKGVPRPLRSPFVVFNTTGPGLVSRTFAEMREPIDDMRILFPDDVCDTRKWHRFGGFGVHQMASSWRECEALPLRRLRRAWDAWVRHRSLCASRLRGAKRSLETTLALGSGSTPSIRQHG